MRAYSMTCKPKHTLFVCAAGLFAACLSGGARAGALNDTGVTSCWNGTATVACSSVDATHPGQDASFGRDAAAATGALTKIGAGPVGFDFTKLSFDGTAVADNAVRGGGVGQHACTRDNVTGLVWDVMYGTANGSWYDPNPATNGGSPGVKNQGTGIDTDTYISTANSSNQCGGTGWRLPTVRELLSVSDLGQGKRPTGYFSSNNTLCWAYNGAAWSSQTVRGSGGALVWAVSQAGLVFMQAKDKAYVYIPSGLCYGTFFIYTMMVR